MVIEVRIRPRSLKSAVRRQSHNRKGVLYILSGTAGGQILALCAAPFLARIYTPDDFGAFTIYVGIVATVGTVSALRLEMAVPLPAGEDEAQSVVLLGMLAVLMTSLFSLAILALVQDNLIEVLGGAHSSWWIWLLPPLFATTGVFLVLNQLAIRSRRFRSIGRRSVVQSVLTASSQVLFGLASLRPSGLILGFGLGQLGGALSLLSGSGLRSVAGRAGRRRQMLYRAAHRYWRFPVILAPSGLINVAGLTAPIFLVAYYYGLEVAGWLGLTQRILAVPVALIGAALGQVYLSELARSVRESSLSARALFTFATRRLCATALLVGSIVFVAAPWLFSIAFGPEWTQSGEYARALAFSLGLQLIAAPLSQTIVVFERQLLQLGWDAAG